MPLERRAVTPLTFTFFAVLACACSGPDSDLTAVDEGAQTGVDPALFRERAPWTGRLVRPRPGERTPDGAVKIGLHNSPDAALNVLVALPTALAR